MRYIRRYLFPLVDCQGELEDEKLDCNFENEKDKYISEKENKLSILYQSSEEFLPYAGISIFSLLKNNVKTIDKVYLVCANISDENKRKLEIISKEFQRQIVYIDSEVLDNFLKENNIPRYKGSYATYYKMFAADLVGENVKRLLYIDADTTVESGLDELLYYDFKDNVLAMSHDAMTLNHKKSIGLKGKAYFCAGVVLFNVEQWRKQECKRKLINHITFVRGDYPVVDQDILNIVFENQVGVLSAKFDWTTLYEQFSYKDLCKIFQLKNSFFYTEKEIEEAKKTIVIYHEFGYFGEQTWNKEETHPFTKKWNEYYMQSPWKDYVKKETKRTTTNKWQKTLYNILPKCIYNLVHRVAVNAALQNRVRK